VMESAQGEMSREEVQTGKLILLIQSGDHKQLEQVLKTNSSLVNHYSGNEKKDTMTPLHFAVMLYSIPCVKILCKYGADVHVKVKTGVWSGKSSLDIAEDCGFDDILEELRKERVKPSDSDNEILEGLMDKEKRLMTLLEQARAESAGLSAEDIEAQNGPFVTDEYLNSVLGPLKEQISLLTVKYDQLEKKNKELSEKLQSQEKIISVIVSKINL